MVEKVQGAGKAGQGGAGGSARQGGDGDSSVGGGAGVKKSNSYKVSKLMIWPTRKINIGNYNTVDVSAGIEVTFDKSIDIDSKEIKVAQEEMRKIVADEMKLQFTAFTPKKVATAKPEAKKV